MAISKRVVGAVRLMLEPAPITTEKAHEAFRAAAPREDGWFLLGDFAKTESLYHGLRSRSVKGGLKKIDATHTWDLREELQNQDLIETCKAEKTDAKGRGKRKKTAIRLRRDKRGALLVIRFIQQDERLFNAYLYGHFELSETILSKSLPLRPSAYHEAVKHHEEDAKRRWAEYYAKSKHHKNLDPQGIEDLSRMRARDLLGSPEDFEDDVAHWTKSKEQVQYWLGKRDLLRKQRLTGKITEKEEFDGLFEVYVQLKGLFDDLEQHTRLLARSNAFKKARKAARVVPEPVRMSPPGRI